MENEMDMPEQAGRGTDSADAGGTMAHLSLGEVVIPRVMLDDPQVMEMLQALFQMHETSLAEFTVGDPANKINPETGYPEFFKIGKIFKSIAKIAAPAALAYFGAPMLSGALGATGAGAAIGGATGLATGGGLKGALTGAAGGALGANIGGLGNTAVGRAIDSASNSAGLGSVFGSPTATLPGIGKVPLGSVGSAPATGAAGASIGGSSSFSPINIAANAFGGMSQDAALKKQQKQLLAANQQQQANLETFNPADITSQPNYQFQLEQGQLGLNKQLAASGALQSGRALKAATEYNQNYASNAFQQAYQNWLQKTGAQNALLGDAGNVRAQTTGAGAQNLAQSLSNAIGSPVGNYGNTGLTLQQLRALGLA